MKPTIESLANGLESLALTLLPGPRENAAAIMGEYGARLDSFGLSFRNGHERPPLQEGLLQVETAISGYRREAERLHSATALGLAHAEAEVSRMVAILSTRVSGRPPGVEGQLGFAALAAAGQLRRVQPWLAGVEPTSQRSEVSAD